MSVENCCPAICGKNDNQKILNLLAETCTVPRMRRFTHGAIRFFLLFFKNKTFFFFVFCKEY